MIAPLIVVGVGRSGTSLVQAMLHAHPEVGFLPETHFLRRYAAPPLRRWAWRFRGPERLRDRLVEDAEFARARIDPDELLEPFGDTERAFDPGAVYRRLLELGKHRLGVGTIGDKDPRLIDFLPAVGRILPGAKVIHVVRDPRDVLVSRRNAEWSRDRSDVSHILAYVAQMRRARTTGPQALGDRYREVRYEDVLRAPEETVGGMCAHLGVEYHPATLAFGGEAADLVSEEEWQWKKETTGPLQRDNTGNWRGEVEPLTLRLVERLCVEPFPDLGYTPDATTRPLSTDERIRLESFAAATEFLARLYPSRTLVG